MTVEELASERHRLEGDIMTLIRDFQRRTGAHVEDLECQSVRYAEGAKEVVSVSATVRV